MANRGPVADVPPLAPFVLERAVRRALEEDIGETGDVTSAAALPPYATVRAVIRAREPGRTAGMEACALAFRMVDAHIRFEPRSPDGADFSALDTLAEIEGPAAAVLTAERVALNFLQRLTGVATLTSTFVKEIDGTMARIAGTRKTTPGLRALERQAIRAGGGADHRFGLGDAILVKDNHIAVAGGVGAALMAVRARADHMTHVSVEIDRLDQLDEALRYSPDVVLLDNFSIPDMATAVRTVGARCTVEASGGVSIQNVRTIAETGVDIISVGALTHSAPAIDLGLDLNPATT